MKRTIPAALAAVPLLATLAFGQSPAPDTTFVLSDAETTAGWGKGTALTNDRKEGQHAISWEIAPTGTAASIDFALGPNRERVARGKTLSFWYKFDGKGVTTFHLKAVAYPLAGGWQALYTLPVPPPGEWRRAVVPLQEFEDQWGETPDEKVGSLQFRVATAKDADARLIVDHLEIRPLPAGVAINTGEKKAAEPIRPLIAKDKPMTLPDHPRLLFSRADVAQMKDRIARTEWAKASFDDLKKRGDDWAGRPIELPARGGQWWHWYACPKHGTRLKTEGPTRHVCPTGGEVYSGYPYDDVVLSAKHDALASAARDLGLLYQLTGERRYGGKAKEILLAYADKYLSYPLHNINGKPQVGGGRVLPQTLDESIWLVAMAQGADAVWDLLSDSDREALKTKLFYPAAVDVIQKHKMGIHNIQCWKNSAVGLTGLLFGDAALVSDAVDGPSGFQAQTRDGIKDDGAWYEGAWGYHFYTMDAIRPLTEAAHRSGIDLYNERYKLMFLAPIELAMPNGQLPAFNDSGKASAMGNANYEIALARYKDPRLALPIATGRRQSLQALINGVYPLPEASKIVEPSKNFPSSGYAVLRAGTGADATWLCLKYGPHGGGHGHPDKNSFVLYGGGRILADDPGTGAYGVPIQDGWYKTTLAHNTLVVDEANQKAATGKILDFQAKDGWSAALVDSGSAIPEVSFRRAAFLLGQDLVAFIDLIAAEDGKPRRLDLAFHPTGAWATTTPGQAATLPQVPGYSYLRDACSLATADGLTLGVAAPAPAAGAGTPGAPATVAFAPGAATTYTIATGVGANTEDRVPIVIARREAPAATYAWAVGIGAGAVPTVTPVSVTDAAGKPIAASEAAAATVKIGNRTYLVVANPGDNSIKAGSWSGSDRLAVIPMR